MSAGTDLIRKTNTNIPANTTDEQIAEVAKATVMGLTLALTPEFLAAAMVGGGELRMAEHVAQKFTALLDRV